MTFNPNEHLMKIGKADYLPVQWRIVWFRENYPQGTIETEMIHFDPDRKGECEITEWIDNPNGNGKRMPIKKTKEAFGMAIFRATIHDGKGGKATGTKSENAASFDDYLEKAETGSIGRALAALGFGTQFTGDEFNEKHRIVDAPVNNASHDESQPTTSAAPTRTQPTRPAPAAKVASDETFMPVGSIEDALRKMFKTCTEFAGQEEGTKIFNRIRKHIVGDKRDIAIVNDELIRMWDLIHKAEDQAKTAKQAVAV